MVDTRSLTARRWPPRKVHRQGRQLAAMAAAPAWCVVPPMRWRCMDWAWCSPMAGASRSTMPRRSSTLRTRPPWACRARSTRSPSCTSTAAAVNPTASSRSSGTKRRRSITIPRPCTISVREQSSERARSHRARTLSALARALAWRGRRHVSRGSRGSAEREQGRRVVPAIGRARVRRGAGRVGRVVRERLGRRARCGGRRRVVSEGRRPGQR